MNHESRAEHESCCIDEHQHCRNHEINAIHITVERESDSLSTHVHYTGLNWAAHKYKTLKVCMYQPKSDYIFSNLKTSFTSGSGRTYTSKHADRSFHTNNILIHYYYEDNEDKFSVIHWKRSTIWVQEEFNSQLR